MNTEVMKKRRARIDEPFYLQMQNPETSQLPQHGQAPRAICHNGVIGLGGAKIFRQIA